jgi:hypothetical protein
MKMTRDGTPKEMFIVLTFGVASVLCRRIAMTRKELDPVIELIKKSGGAPKIYRCRLIKSR